MVYFITLLLSAQVAFFSFHLRLAHAAPFKVSEVLAPKDISLALSTINSAGAISEVVKFSHDTAAAAVVSHSEATVTLWESSTTVTVQPTPSTAPGSLSYDWVLPEYFTDLSPFNIERIAYGSPNIAVVTGIPATASALIPPVGVPTPTATPSFFSASESVITAAGLPRPWTNSSATYRLFFPSGSINPGNRPQGGSDFYASPIALRSATNVTLMYSIFFPSDFEWVRGGKLPGLYGGHDGCSGGNDAKTCFSTRMMWRSGGAGELYLYVPKDKQTSELCQAPPRSVCDATYGLSIGRGSFHFAAGDWTHISQTVRLNTPGEQDGGFELVVNSQRVMRRDDVFYRDVPSVPTRHDGDNGDNSANGGNRDGGWVGDGDGYDSGNRGSGEGGGDLLGDILRGEDEGVDILSPLLLSSRLSMEDYGWASEAPLFAPEAVPDTPVRQTISNTRASVSTPIVTKTLMTTVTRTQATPKETSTTLSSSLRVNVESHGDNLDAAGFSGIFFSTFFGGHEQSWASPKDQYTYFKDFGLVVNA